MIQKIKDFFKSSTFRKLMMFAVACLIILDTIAGTCIPLAYGQGCGWFAIPNLIIDIYAITLFVKWYKDEDSH